jgi:hypothetical protein
MSDRNHTAEPKPGTPEMLAQFIYASIAAHAEKNPISTLEILGALELVKANILNAQVK